MHIWEMLKAQYNLANMYANGQGVQQEFTKAREWWTQAKAQGDEDVTKALKR
jgi:TPR repeat protein